MRNVSRLRNVGRDLRRRYRFTLAGFFGAWGAWEMAARYWEHLIRDGQDYRAHLNYLRFNPLEYCHVIRIAGWTRSTFHAGVARGVHALGWAGSDRADSLGEIE